MKTRFVDNKKSNRNSAVTISATTKLISFMFSFALLVPFIWGVAVTDHDARSKAEKRNLSPRPSFSTVLTSETYFSELADYLRDHIGFGLRVNKFYQKLMFDIFDTVGVENISKGKDDFVFLTSHNPNKHNTIFYSLCEHQNDSRSVVEAASKISKYVNDAGHTAIFAVPISKPTLYPEKLPFDIKPEIRKSCESFLSNGNFLTKAKEVLAEQNILLHYPYQLFFLHKNDEAFYPKSNFHWDGASAHLFVKSLFESLGVDKHLLNDFDVGGELLTKHADLKSLGFRRETTVWDYPYRPYNISKNQPYKLASIKEYYARARDISFYETENPIQNRNAVVISNSFGAYTARHLASGYKNLTHININHMERQEKKALFEYLFSLNKNMDFIFLFHDDAMAGKNALEKIAWDL